MALHWKEYGNMHWDDSGSDLIWSKRKLGDGFLMNPSEEIRLYRDRTNGQYHLVTIQLSLWRKVVNGTAESISWQSAVAVLRSNNVGIEEVANLIPEFTRNVR